MSHRWEVGKTTFVGNSDLSGECRIIGTRPEGLSAKDAEGVTEIPFEDMLGFVAMQAGFNVVSATGSDEFVDHLVEAMVAFARPDFVKLRERWLREMLVRVENLKSPITKADLLATFLLGAGAKSVDACEIAYNKAGDWRI